MVVKTHTSQNSDREKDAPAHDESIYGPLRGRNVLALLAVDDLEYLTMSDTDAKWMSEHSIELQEKYAGRWIAVYGEQVVEVGQTALEAAEQARKHAKPGEYILEALDAQTDVIYGCF